MGESSSSKSHDSRRLFFFGEVTEEKTEKVVNGLLEQEDKDPTKDILLYIDSYGGLVDSAMAVHEVINMVRCRVVGICVGKAMSAGAFILMSCTHGFRFMTPNARLMMHEMAGWNGGSVSEMDIELEETKRLQKLWLDLTLKYTKMDEAEVKRVVRPTSSYMTAEQARERGIIDMVLTSNRQLAKKVKA